MIDDFVGAICLTLNLVLVIPTSGNIPLQNSIPLENGKLCVPVNLLFGFAVDFIKRHLYRPFIVLHFIVIGAICRNRNSLVAAQRTGRGIEAVRDGDFIVAKRNICKLCPRRGDGSIYHALRFVFSWLMAAFLAASAAASASAWLVNGPSCPLSVLVLVLETS